MRGDLFQTRHPAKAWPDVRSSPAPSTTSTRATKAGREVAARVTGLAPSLRRSNAFGICDHSEFV